MGKKVKSRKLLLIFTGFLARRCLPGFRSVFVTALFLCCMELDRYLQSSCVRRSLSRIG